MIVPDSKKVSVIMGVYNCAETLSKAIDSVINQTYHNWELIMCDDGSTDDTYQIAESYKKQFPDKIILLKNEKNIKLAATLNHCLAYATGEYIARMDADDENMAERFEIEVDFLNNHPEITCVGTGYIVFDERGERGVRIGEEYPHVRCLIHGAPFAHPTIMMRKEAYDALDGYTVAPETLRAEDIDLWFRFFEKGFTGYVIQKPLYRYRESLHDFKKRSFKAALGIAKVCLKGYRRLHYPWYLYPYALKSIVGALIPDKIMQRYHYKKDNRKHE